MSAQPIDSLRMGWVAPGKFAFGSLARTGELESVSRYIAEEIPIAVELNGIGYAVLMASGDALEDLGHGFALTERLVDHAGQVLSVDAYRAEAGMMLRITLVPDCADRVRNRIRHRSSDSSCGLCGIENLEQAMRPLPHLPPTEEAIHSTAIFAALDLLHQFQPLNARTGSVHAAAFCTRDGAIRLVREDVGRHNAFDKLIGAMMRAGMDWDGGFALLSSRCSYELVEKAVLARCPALVTISAPTSLAIDRAAEAGLTLIVLARHDAVLCAGTVQKPATGIEPAVFEPD